MQSTYRYRKLNILVVLMVTLSLFANMTVSARGLADSGAPYVTDVTRLADPLYIGITIVFPSGIPNPITYAGFDDQNGFTCVPGSNPNTLYCSGHRPGDYPAIFFVASGPDNVIPVIVPAPPNPPQHHSHPCHQECCNPC